MTIFEGLEDGVYEVPGPEGWRGLCYRLDGMFRYRIDTDDMYGPLLSATDPNPLRIGDLPAEAARVRPWTDADRPSDRIDRMGDYVRYCITLKPQYSLPGTAVLDLLRALSQTSREWESKHLDGGGA